MTDEIRNVFISHLHEDDEGLDRLKALVDGKGLSLRDSSITDEQPNAANDPDYIKSAILAPRIRWASVLVVYVSPQTKSSEWVNWEIEYAQKNRQANRRSLGAWGEGQ